MIKVHGLNKFAKYLMFVVLFFAFLGVLGCKKEKEFNIEENNNLFFERFKGIYNEYDADIQNLSLYYLNDYFYYDVKFYSQKRDIDLNLLYVFRYGLYEIYFSIKNPEENIQYFPKEYFEYLEAKEIGERKIYTREEIEILENNLQNIQS